MPAHSFYNLPNTCSCSYLPQPSPHILLSQRAKIATLCVNAPGGCWVSGEPTILVDSGPDGGGTAVRACPYYMPPSRSSAAEPGGLRYSPCNEQVGLDTL